MGSFALASQGYPQNASVQNQFANALNGTVTTYAPVIVTGTGALRPAQLTFASGTVSATYLAAKVSGDTGSGRGLAQVRSDGYGALTAQTAAGATVATLYATSGGGLQTDQNWVVNGTATVVGTLTLPGGGTGGGATVTGTFSGAVSGTAANLAAGGTFLTQTTDAAVQFEDDGSNIHLLPSNNAGTAPPAARRGLYLRSVNTSNAVAAGCYFTADNPGRIALDGTATQFSFGAKGGGLSRISRAWSGQFSGTTTISHGLGTTPDALVVTEGDGGSGGSAIFGVGAYNMGSANVSLFTQTNNIWARCMAVKFSG